MNNLEKLQIAKVLPKEFANKLTQAELAIIEALTPAEIEFLIETRKKIKSETNLDMMIAPPTHHF